MLETGKFFHVSRVPDDKQNFPRLVNKRVEIIIANIHVGQYIINTFLPRADRAKVTHHPKPWYSTTAHMVFSKRRDESPMLVKIFNKGIKQLHKNGRYKQLMDTYMDGVIPQGDSEARVD